MAFRFEWDHAKDLVNRRKHGVSFVDAVAMFDDPLHVSVKERSQDAEQRWQTYGRVAGLVLINRLSSNRNPKREATL
jgi:uncharacterized protein